jgi:tellurite resistance protein
MEDERMLVIFGWRSRSHTIGAGRFFCPREGGDRDYEHKEAKRWFTLFFIPLIPLNRLGDYVECTSCRSTFYTSVLDAPTGASIEDVMTQAIRYVAVSLTLADGYVDEEERIVATEVVRQFASHDYSAADFASDLEALDPAAMIDHLEELGSILNEHGKEAVLTAAMRLAAADGSIDSSEIAIVESIGKALTMSDAHVRGVIATASERA